MCTATVRTIDRSQVKTFTSRARAPHATKQSSSQGKNVTQSTSRECRSARYLCGFRLMMAQFEFFWYPNPVAARDLAIRTAEGHGCISLIVLKPEGVECREAEHTWDSPRSHQV